MHRCTPSVVSTSHIKTTQFEEVDRYRLVSLGGNVEHIDAKVVLCVDVCTMLDKNLTGIGVTLERSKVKGCETITMVLLVDPGCNVVFYHSRRYQSKKCFETL